MPHLPRRTLLQTALPALALALPAGAAGDPLATLLALIARRLEIGRIVAQAKWNSGAPIADPEREARVVAAARAQAAAAGIDPDALSALLRAQIEASKLLQQRLHAEWRAAAHAPFADVPDLATDIRARLDRLGEALPPALAAALPKLPGNCGDLDRRAETMLAGFDAPVRAQAIEPLRRWAGCDGHGKPRVP